MTYFLSLNLKNDKKRTLIAGRKNRKSILGQSNMGKMFKSGDILTINFWIKSYNYYFEGLCLSLKNKMVLNPNVTILLRNIYYGVGIEVKASYFLNRLFINTFMSDYKRKNYKYRASKLYYLRFKENKATKVK